MSLEINAGPDEIRDDPSHNIDAITGIGLGSATVDEFCELLERDLDRPVVNETKLDGKFDFEVKDPAAGAQQKLKGPFRSTPSGPNGPGDRTRSEIC